MRTEEMQREFEEIILAAHRVSVEVGTEVERILQTGLEQPLSREEQVALLARVLESLRVGCKESGDEKGLRTLTGDLSTLVERAIQARLATPGARPDRPSIEFVQYNGMEPRPVQPVPIFHERAIPMVAGYVRLNDIQLWSGNERLEIHLNQFRQRSGRVPSHSELLDIMCNELKLPGMPEVDQFKIKELARSIANNGVQKPPILAFDGTLLDGNRRVAACHMILASDEFTPEEKKRAQYVYVWRLTEHATPDDRNAVVVALNFESDYKIEWPSYIKARKVYEEWQSMLLLEGRTAGPSRQAELKRDLSRKFALGPDTSTVNRYLKMMEWATEFEDHLINDKNHDAHQVRHATNEYFEYFDEMAKGRTGRKGRGVAQTLDENESFKHLVFDLLFEGKIDSFVLIRDLKFMDDDLQKGLADARDEKDVERAQEMVAEALGAARARRAETRVTGANTRIESFVRFLEGLPIAAFRDEVSRENLQRLLKALRLVEKHVRAILGDTGSAA